MERIRISKKNSKLGRILNISLPPIKSCVANVPCKEKCYAIKSYRQYPNVKNAWNTNLHVYLTDPDSYFEQINNVLQNKLAVYFRFHVSGDIPNSDYLNRMIKLSIQNPHVKFLCFTKNYKLFQNKKADKLPNNLSVMVSAWTKYRMPKYIKQNGYRIAWVDDGNETRFNRKNSVYCTGHCDICYECWNVNTNHDVILPLH